MRKFSLWVFFFLCFQKPVRIRTEEGPSLLIFPQKPRSESKDMEVDMMVANICVWVCVCACLCVGGSFSRLCQMQLPELFSISPSLCFTQSSPCSPCSPRDSTSVSRCFSSRSETQVGQTNQDHSEKVLLNLEEVKVSGREIPSLWICVSKWHWSPHVLDAFGQYLQGLSEKRLLCSHHTHSCAWMHI